MKIGTNESGNSFTLPADAASQTFAALGRRGSGKTTFGVVDLSEHVKAFG